MQDPLSQNIVLHSSLLTDLPKLTFQGLLTLGLTSVGVSLLNAYGSALALLLPVPTTGIFAHTIAYRIRQEYHLRSSQIEAHGGIFNQTVTCISMSRVGEAYMVKPFLLSFFDIGHIFLMDRVSGQVIFTLEAIEDPESIYAEITRRLDRPQSSGKRRHKRDRPT